MLLPRQGLMESIFKSFMVMIMFKVGVMVENTVIIKVEVMVKVIFKVEVMVTMIVIGWGHIKG